MVLNLNKKDGKKLKRIELRLKKFKQKSKGMTNTAKDKLRYWVEYVYIYDRIMKIAQNHPELPPVPKFLLSLEQEEAVRIEIMDRKIKRLCPQKGHPDGPYKGLKIMRDILKEHVEHERWGVKQEIHEH